MRGCACPLTTGWLSTRTASRASSLDETRAGRSCCSFTGFEAYRTTASASARIALVCPADSRRRVEVCPSPRPTCSAKATTTKSETLRRAADGRGWSRISSTGLQVSARSSVEATRTTAVIVPNPPQTCSAQRPRPVPAALAARYVRRADSKGRSDLPVRKWTRRVGGCTFEPCQAMERQKPLGDRIQPPLIHPLYPRTDPWLQPAM